MKANVKLTATIVICAAALAHAYAQDKKKKPMPAPKPAINKPVPVSADTADNTVSDSEQLEVDTSLKTKYYLTEDSYKDSSTQTHYHLFPEFYSYWPVTKGDTIIKYQGYDADNNYVNMDTVTNIDDVRHIQLVKVFTNYLHTYIDSDGKPRASNASKTIYKYDRTDNETWKAYDYASGFTSELKENKREIVKADSILIMDPITGNKRLTIRKYYKVTEEKHKGEIDTDSDK